MVTLYICNQQSPVLLPALELYLLAEEGEEVVELGAPSGVGEDLVVEDLAAPGVDHADLEVDRALLLLQSQQVLLHRRVGHLGIMGQIPV